MLNKDQILKAEDIITETVHVEQWGGDVCIKGMTGAERDKFESSILVMKGKDQQVNLANVRSKLLVYCLCNEKGERLFTQEDIQALSGKSAAALQTCFEVAQRLSGIGEQAIEELTEAQKDPFEGSSSD